MKTLLHVGCGVQSKEVLPPLDFETRWKEIRVDIDPDVKPDIVDDIKSLSKIPDGSAHILFSKHNVEHLAFHEVPSCLENFHRVLDDSGLALIRTPDLEMICHHVILDGLEKTLYVTTTPEGEQHPVKPLDIIFGASWAIERGNNFMAHRTAFTKQTLKDKLLAAGFEYVDIHVDREFRELRAAALKKTEGNIYWSMTGKTPPGGG